jgi:hypothetical protein
MWRKRFVLGFGLVLCLGLALAASQAAARSSSIAGIRVHRLAVTSSLSGHKRLGHRIHWVAKPNVSPANVLRVVYLIDGKWMWTENHSPYDYGGNKGSYLVTSFLSPGIHTFTVQVESVSGGTAHTSTRARVSKAPEPPSHLAGSWQRFIGAQGGPGSPPSGIWRLVISSVGWQIRDTQGTGDLLDVVYPKPGEVQIQTGMVTGRPKFDQNGWCNNEPGPTLHYSWTVENSLLRLRLLSGTPCQGFNAFATGGAWMRKRS